MLARVWIKWNVASIGSGSVSPSNNYSFLEGMITYSYEAKYQCLFPYNWHVDAFLLQTFCERTKEHVLTVLSRYENPEQVDVPLLVTALRTTMQFERVRM